MPCHAAPVGLDAPQAPPPIRMPRRQIATAAPHRHPALSSQHTAPLPSARPTHTLTRGALNGESRPQEAVPRPPLALHVDGEGDVGLEEVGVAAPLARVVLAAVAAKVLGHHLADRGVAWVGGVV